MKTKYYLFITLLFVVGITSCSDKDSDISPEGVEGYVQVGLSVGDQNVVKTKAAATDVNTFAVKIENKEGVAVKEYSSFSQLKEDGTLKLKAGKYTVKANTNGNFEDQSGVPYYSGSKDFEVLPNVFADAKVICSMQHAKIRVILSEGLMGSIAPDYVIIVSNGSVEHTYIDFDGGVSEDWYFAPSTTFTIKIKGTVSESGEAFEITNDIPNDVKANDFLTVNLGLGTRSTRSTSVSDFNIKVTAI